MSSLLLIILHSKYIASINLWVDEAGNHIVDENNNRIII